MPPTDPIFFPTPADLVSWFAANHRRERELWLGFHKRATGRPSVTWPESVDAALRFGWIDGVRKSLGATTYMIRFTPRKTTSIWSAVNIRRMKDLIAQGLVHPEGIAAFEARRDDRSAVYAYEQRKSATFAPAEERAFRAVKAAWTWFTSQAPSYQRTATYWVTSAKKEETRQRRLATLIADSRLGRKIAPLTPSGTRKR